LVNSSGNIVSKRGYEDIDNYSSDGKIYAKLVGYKTELTTKGEEVTPISKQIFDEAYNMSASDAQEKFDKYMLCIAIDNEGYKAPAYNNIGSLLEDLGDVDSALGYYEKARNLGNETARKNIKRIKFDRTMNALEQIGNTLTQVGQTINQSGSYSGLQQGSSYSGDSYGSSINSGSSSGKHSYSWWKDMYDRWDRNAKSCYESLTNLGYRVSKNGKDTGGGAAGTWNSGSFMGMKRNLRNAQKEMRNIRAQARKDGHNIPQSNYETIDVSF